MNIRYENLGIIIRGYAVEYNLLLEIIFAILIGSLNSLILLAKKRESDSRTR